jgi:hypothetical protein
MELQRNKLESMSDAVDPPEETPAPEQENVNES